MKIGSTYEYIRAPWTIRPGKVIPASTLRFVIEGFDAERKFYSVVFANGSRSAIDHGSPMQRGSIEVPA